MTSCIETRKRKARYLQSPESSDLEDNAINKENNQFIDSIFAKPKESFVENLISFNSLGKSSITVSKIVSSDEPNKTDKCQKSQKPLTNKTNKYLDKSKLSVYDMIYDDEISDQDFIELVDKGKKKRVKKNSTKKMSRLEREAQKIRQEEEDLLQEAMREYKEIKNYKLIVETVHDDY